MSSKYMESFAKNLKNLIGNSTISEFAKKLIFPNRPFQDTYCVKGKFHLKTYAKLQIF